MKQVCLAFVLICGLSFSPLPALADPALTIVTVGDTVSMTLSEIIDCGLPVLYFETVDGEEPTCDYVSSPPGCMGYSITNANKVPGRLAVYNRVNGEDSVLYDSGDYEKDVSGMTIKVRGNTSAYDAKKPYKIKLQKKFDLLFGGCDSIYKDKEWLLLRDDYLTTITGFKVNELVKMTWTPRHRFVNVVINDSYRGAYLLCESVKRNPDCRLNVDKTTGFIYEFDPYWWNESLYVTSSQHPSYGYTFKYPDEDDVTEEHLAYMQALVTAYETSLNDGTFSDFIDVRSFAGWCLVHDLLGTKDAGGTNMFYTKYDTTASSKIVMPLAWDFDMAFRTESLWSSSHEKHMTRLFNSSNRAFTGEYADLWREIRGTFVDDATNFLVDFRRSVEGRSLQKSFNLDYKVYGRTLSVALQTVKYSNWFSSRYGWLDDVINVMNPLGDVNVDGQLSITDVTHLINLLLNEDYGKCYAADVNEDGKINISDVSTLISMLLQNS